MRYTVENERSDEEMRCGAVKLKTKGTPSFNRAGPLRDKINRRKHYINRDAERSEMEKKTKKKKESSYVAVSLKDRDKNQVNVTNGLKTIRCVKTERREETEEMIVAGAYRREGKKVGRRIDGFNDAV